MASPVLPPIAIDKIPTDPNAIVALMAFGYSVLITAVNYIAFRSNRKEERRYHREFALYQLLVLPGCNKLIDFTVTAHAQLELLLPKCLDHEAKGDTRQHVEKSVEELDRANALLESDVLVVVSGFSKDLSRELGVAVESYHDRMAALFSEFDRKKIGTDFAAKQNAAYRKHTEAYIDAVFAKIRESCPTA